MICEGRRKLKKKHYNIQLIKKGLCTKNKKVHILRSVQVKFQPPGPGVMLGTDYEDILLDSKVRNGKWVFRLVTPHGPLLHGDFTTVEVAPSFVEFAKEADQKFSSRLSEIKLRTELFL